VEKSVVAAGVASRGLPGGSIRGSIFLVLDDVVALVDLNRDEPVDVACVVSGASFRGLSYVAPGQLVTLFGRSLGPVRLEAFETGEPLPTSLDGTEVLFNGVPAPVLAGLSSQLNVVAPSSIGGGDVWLEVKRKGVRIFRRALRGFGSRPEPMLQITADGRTIASPDNRFALLPDLRNEDGSLNGPENPAASGSQVTVFTTGLGELDMPLPDSGYGDGLARPLERFVVDTSVGRLVDVETQTVPGRTTAVSALRFRVPQTGGRTLSFTIQPASGQSIAYSVGLPNFLYVRRGN
jgi:uncharacterized protein (TIGR03437 family)